LAGNAGFNPVCRETYGLIFAVELFVKSGQVAFKIVVYNHRGYLVSRNCGVINYALLELCVTSLDICAKERRGATSHAMLIRMTS
jgi:hypothetical protein